MVAKRQVTQRDGWPWSTVPPQIFKRIEFSFYVVRRIGTLIEEFEALPERNRSEIVAELARLVAQAPHDLPRCG